MKLASLVAFAVCAALGQPAASQYAFAVTVMQPGFPSPQRAQKRIHIVLRAVDDAVVYEHDTDDHGFLRIDFRSTKRPVRIEAIQMIQPDRYSGSIESLDQGATRVCLLLPAGCLND